MSRVIKAAVWRDNPRLVEVPAPLPPPPVVVEEEEPIEEGSIPVEEDPTPKINLDYAIWVSMKIEAEKQKAEAEMQTVAAENLLMATQQEVQTLLKKTNEEVEALRQSTNEEILSARAELNAEIAEKTRFAQEESTRMLKEAEEEAVNIRETAKSEGYKEGLDSGYKDGYKEGNEKALLEQKDAILAANAKAEKTLQIAEEEKTKYVQQAEKEIVDVILHAVDKVLPQHFIDVPQVILPLVRKALLKIRDQSRIVIHVAPAYYDLVLMAKNELQGILDGNAVLEVKSDEALNDGDVLLESPNGNVDARLDTQIEAIKKAILDVML